MVCIRAATMCNESWVISNMVATTMLSLLQTLKEYETCLGYNSLCYLTLHYEDWNTNMSKYKLFQIAIGQPDQLI